MWQRLGDHSPYSTTWTSPTTGCTRWHPLNQSLYVGYKVMLAGLLIIGKGDRIAMNSSVETRYPLLDDDVIAFCAAIAPEYKLHGMTEKWILRQVAARTLPVADRQPPQDDVPRQPGPRRSSARSRPAWVDQLLSPRVAPRRPATSTPTAVLRERAAADAYCPGSPRRGSSWTWA